MVNVPSLVRKKPPEIPPLGESVDLAGIKASMGNIMEGRVSEPQDLDKPSKPKMFVISAERLALLELYESRLENKHVELAYSLRYLPYIEFMEIAKFCEPDNPGRFCEMVAEWAVKTIGGDLILPPLEIPTVEATVS